MNLLHISTFVKPPLAAGQDAAISGAEANSGPVALAIFKSDFARFKGFPKGVMVSSPAVVADRGKDGSGRVVLISPHPEDGEPCTKGLFRNVFRWAAGNDKEELDLFANFVSPEKDGARELGGLREGGKEGGRERGREREDLGGLSSRKHTNRARRVVEGPSQTTKERRIQS